MEAAQARLRLETRRCRVMTVCVRKRVALCGTVQVRRCARAFSSACVALSLCVAFVGATCRYATLTVTVCVRASELKVLFSMMGVTKTRREFAASILCARAKLLQSSTRALRQLPRRCLRLRLSPAFPKRPCLSRLEFMRKRRCIRKWHRQLYRRPTWPPCPPLLQAEQWQAHR